MQSIENCKCGLLHKTETNKLIISGDSYISLSIFIGSGGGGGFEWGIKCKLIVLGQTDVQCHTMNISIWWKYDFHFQLYAN